MTIKKTRSSLNSRPARAALNASSYHGDPAQDGIDAARDDARERCGDCEDNPATTTDVDGNLICRECLTLIEDR